MDSSAALAEVIARSAPKAERLAPGGSTPFAVVFFDCPEDVAERELRLSVTDAADLPAPTLDVKLPSDSGASDPEWPVPPAPVRPVRIRSGHPTAEGRP